MATILETGNHIAQNGDGGQRRSCAHKFIVQVQQALKGQSPFKPISFPEKEQLYQWLIEFPDSVMQGKSLGDLCIDIYYCDWAFLCKHLLHNFAIGLEDANARMYFRLRGESPCISGKFTQSSVDSRSITLAPHPSLSRLSKIMHPIFQQSSAIEELATMTTCRKPNWIRSLI
jgi:hypothetical protein